MSKRTAEGLGLDPVALLAIVLLIATIAGFWALFTAG